MNTKVIKTEASVEPKISPKENKSSKSPKIIHTIQSNSNTNIKKSNKKSRKKKSKIKLKPLDIKNNNNEKEKNNFKIPIPNNTILVSINTCKNKNGIQNKDNKERTISEIPKSFSLNKYEKNEKDNLFGIMKK